MAKGGKRKGAGRPVGVKNSTPRLRDYLKPKDVNEFIEFLLANYMEDSKLMIWMGDHIFGKAPQQITGADGGPLIVEISEHVAKKNVANTRTG